MMNKQFEQKLIKLVFENSLTKKKLLLASEIYLNSSIKLISKDKDAIQYRINEQNINLTYRDNRVICYKDNNISSIDENVVACLLDFKRQYYITNEIYFKLEDLQLNSYYYHSFFVSNICYEEYQYRFNFYYGLIDKSYILGLKEYCIKVMLDFFGMLDARFTYDSKYLEIDKQNLFKIVKDKFNLLYENSNDIINSFNMDQYPITTLGKFIYISVINRPLILQNNQFKGLYEYVFANYLNSLKSTKLYKDLQKQYTISKWYNKEIDDTYMKNNINEYEVMYCYVSYLYEQQQFKEISNLFENYKFYVVNNEIMAKIMYSHYYVLKFDNALNILKKLQNISLDIYIKYKKEMPLLFNEENINSIIESIIDSNDSDEITKILEYEDKEEYKILILAKKDFNIINDRFNDYLGRYDHQLIKIYQKEISTNLLNLRGHYNNIPEYILEKLEKFKRIKNAKYYICEMIDTVIKDNYISFEDDLINYCLSLGV